MKKLMLLILLVLPLLSLASAEAWLSIADMQAQAPQRWTQTFDTPWRSVAIDAAIRVPQVDKLPVVFLCGGAEEPIIAAEEAGWDRIEYRGPYDLLLWNHVPGYPKKVDGIQVGSPVSKGVWYDGFAPTNTYVPMDSTPLGEIVAQVKAAIAKLGYDPEAFELDTPARLWAHHVYAQGTKRDILPGYIFMDIRTRVEGIPVMSHIWDAVVSHHGISRDDEFSLSATSSIGYDGYLGGLSHIYLTPLSVKQVLAEDVPLCPFDKVLSCIETEIEAGHIRKIYDIELGYVLYNQPGSYRTKEKHTTKQSAYAQYQAACYYAQPMWQVNCLYVEKASGKLRNVSGYTDDERNSLDYYHLLIDAQTGELVQQSSSKDRCEFKGFLSWEDVYP